MPSADTHIGELVSGDINRRFGAHRRVNRSTIKKVTMILPGTTTEIEVPVETRVTVEWDNLTTGWKVGDQVRVIVNPWAGTIGTIERIDGAYHIVRFDGSKHQSDVYELYPSEFEEV